jgi:hypothetical protein
MENTANLIYLIISGIILLSLIFLQFKVSRDVKVNLEKSQKREFNKKMELYDNPVEIGNLKRKHKLDSIYHPENWYFWVADREITLKKTNQKSLDKKYKCSACSFIVNEEMYKLNKGKCNKCIYINDPTLKSLIPPPDGYRVYNENYSGLFWLD